MPPRRNRDMRYIVMHETSREPGVFVARDANFDNAIQAIIGCFTTLGRANYHVIEYLEGVRAGFDVDIMGIPTSINIEDLVQEWEVMPARGELVLWYRRPDVDSRPCRVRVIRLDWTRVDQHLEADTPAMEGCDCVHCNRSRG